MCHLTFFLLIVKKIFYYMYMVLGGVVDKRCVPSLHYTATPTPFFWTTEINVITKLNSRCIISVPVKENVQIQLSSLEWSMRSWGKPHLFLLKSLYQAGRVSGQGYVLRISILPLQFWNLILELFQQCGIFCFPFYYPVSQ